MFSFAGHVHMDLCPGSGLGLGCVLATVARPRLHAAAVLHVVWGQEVSEAKLAQMLLCQSLVPGSTASFFSLWSVHRGLDQTP